MFAHVHPICPFRPTVAAVHDTWLMDGEKVNLQTFPKSAAATQHAGKTQVFSKKSQSAPIDSSPWQLFRLSRAALSETLHVNRNLKDCVSLQSVMHKNTDFLFVAQTEPAGFWDWIVNSPFFIGLSAELTLNVDATCLAHVRSCSRNVERRPHLFYYVIPERYWMAFWEGIGDLLGQTVF